MKTEYLLPSLKGHVIGPWPDPHKSTSSVINISFRQSQLNISNFILVVNQLDAQNLFYNKSSLNLCTGRPPIGVMIPEAF